MKTYEHLRYLLLRISNVSDKICRENQNTQEIFRTRIDRPWVQPYNEYRVSRPEVKRPGRCVDCPTPLSAEVKGRVELHLCSPS